MNGVQLASEITWKTGVSTTIPGVPYLRELLKFATRAAFHWQATRAWLAYWNSSPFLTQLAKSRPGILKKIYRPYLFRQLDCQQRLAALVFHYNFMLTHKLGDLVMRAAQAPVVLHQFSGKSDRLYRLEMIAITCMEREGELALQLCDETAVIYTVAFTFHTAGQQVQLAVGCLQGRRADDARERIRVATRDFHGLRPQSLLMRVLQQLALEFGCDSLQLVGNANRVMLRQLRKGRMVADYDSTWQELGALRQNDGNFALACARPACPDLTRIATHKRSEAKKRHQLLTSVADHIGSALA